MTPATIAISGHSGSGKTTLIVKLLERLERRGLSVGVLKHDAHRLDFDREGKDTDRFRKAGAVRVEAFDASWWFQVTRSDPTRGLEPLREGFRGDLDLLIVEGGKSSGLDKIWLRPPGGDGPPDALTGVIADLERCDDTLDEVEQIVVDWHCRRFLAVARAVTLVVAPGAALSDRCVDEALGFCDDVLVAGTPSAPASLTVVPPVVDVPGVLGCVLGVMRWSAGRTSLVVDGADAGCDAGRLRKLWSSRRPGLWGLVGETKGLPAVMEPQLAHVLEHVASRDDWIAAILAHGRVQRP